jgi:hypothetical protein
MVRWALCAGNDQPSKKISCHSVGKLEVRARGPMGAGALRLPQNQGCFSPWGLVAGLSLARATALPSSHSHSTELATAAQYNQSQDLSPRLKTPVAGGKVETSSTGNMGELAQRDPNAHTNCLSPRRLEFRRGLGGPESAFKKPADGLRTRDIIPLCPSIDSPDRLRRKPNTDQRVYVRCRPANLGLDRFWHG